MHAIPTEHDPVADLQAELTARGITVRVDGTELRFTAPPGALTAELRAAIQTHKHDLLVALTGFAPLDRDIIRSTARSHTTHQIEARLTHAQTQAAAPGATPLQHQLVHDWTAIRRAKEQGVARRAPVRALSEPGPSSDQDPPANAADEVTS